MEMLICYLSSSLMFKKFHLPDERWRWSKSEGDSGLVPEIDLDTESVYAKISA